MNSIDFIVLIYDHDDLNDDYDGMFLRSGKWAMHFASMDAEGIIHLHRVRLHEMPQHSIIGQPGIASQPIIPTARGSKASEMTPAVVDSMAARGVPGRAELFGNHHLEFAAEPL